MGEVLLSEESPTVDFLFDSGDFLEDIPRRSSSSDDGLLDTDLLKEPDLGDGFGLSLGEDSLERGESEKMPLFDRGFGTGGLLSFSFSFGDFDPCSKSRIGSGDGDRFDMPCFSPLLFREATFGGLCLPDRFLGEGFGDLSA